MPRVHRKEQRWLTQKSCRKGKGVQRRPAIHRFVFLKFLLLPATMTEVIALFGSVSVLVLKSSHFIYRMPVRVDEALHLGLALVIGFSRRSGNRHGSG